MYHNLCFEQKYENIKKTTENCHFTDVKIRCMMHWHVFVISYHFISVLAAECLPFGKERSFGCPCSTCILTICNFSYFRFWVDWLQFEILLF